MIYKLVEFKNFGSAPIWLRVRIISSVPKPCIVPMLPRRYNMTTAIIDAVCIAQGQLIMTSLTKQFTTQLYQSDCGFVWYGAKTVHSSHAAPPLQYDHSHYSRCAPGPWPVNHDVTYQTIHDWADSCYNKTSKTWHLRHVFHNRLNLLTSNVNAITLRKRP